MEGIDCAFQSVVTMDQKRLELQLTVPGRPVRIDVDPEFDLFRKLDRDETPAALTQALGARDMLVLLPSAAPKALLEAYGDLARSLSESGPDNVEVKLDSQIQHIPSDRSVVLLGWENAFRSQVVSALSQFDVTVKAKEVRISRGWHQGRLKRFQGWDESFPTTTNTAIWDSRVTNRKILPRADGQ